MSDSRGAKGRKLATDSTACLRQSSCSSFYHLQQEKLAIKFISNACSFVSDSKNPDARVIYENERHVQLPAKPETSSRTRDAEAQGFPSPHAWEGADLQMQTPAASLRAGEPFPARQELQEDTLSPALCSPRMKE